MSETTIEGYAAPAAAPHKATLITAWAAILSTALFKILLQEIFHYPVSENLQYAVTALIAAAGLGLTYRLEIGAAPAGLLRPIPRFGRRTMAGLYPGGCIAGSTRPAARPFLQRVYAGRASLEPCW